MSDGHEQDDGGGGTDPRLEVMQDYTLKTLKIKNDKWAKVCMYIRISCISFEPVVFVNM